MKIKSPIGFLALWSAFLATGTWILPVWSLWIAGTPGAQAVCIAPVAVAPAVPSCRLDGLSEDEFLQFHNLPADLWPEELHDGWNEFSEVSQAVWGQVFNDSSSAPSVVYTISGEFSGPRAYAATNHSDQEFVFDAVLSSAPMTEDTYGEALPDGLVVHSVMAKMAGPAGHAWVSGTVFSFDHPQSGRVSGFSLGELLDAETVIALEQLRGPVLEAAYELSLAGPSMAETAALASSEGVELEVESALSSEASNDESGGDNVDGSGIDDCVRAAVAVQAVRTAVAMSAYVACKAAVQIAKAKALVLCAKLALIPFKGWIVAGICAAAVIAANIIAKKGCGTALKEALKVIAREFAIALAACGAVRTLP